MIRQIVSDTGPLISLEKINNGYVFIRKLYDKIIIPPAVMEELSEHLESFNQYLERFQIRELIEIRKPIILPSLKAHNFLHKGEIEAISLAKNLNLSLLIEESAGRRIANSMGLKFSGMARQVANACRNEIITNSEAKEKLLELLHANRINRKIYEAILIRIS